MKAWHRSGLPDEEGSSLIELLAAVAIFVTALTGILGFLATGVITLREVDIRQTALEEALRQVEDIKNLPFDHSIPDCPTTQSFYESIQPISPLYEISVITCRLETGIQIITATVTFKGGEQVVFEDYKTDR